jgi:hypothetical protein
MTAERLRNRLAKIEGRLAPHRFVAYVEDGESEHDALARAGVLVRKWAGPNLASPNANRLPHP